MTTPAPDCLTSWAAASSRVDEESGFTRSQTSTSILLSLSKVTTRSRMPAALMPGSVTRNAFCAPRAFTWAGSVFNTPGPKWMSVGMGKKLKVCPAFICMTLSLPIRQRSAAHRNPMEIQGKVATTMTATSSTPR